MPRGKLVAVDHVGGEQEGVVREQVLSELHTFRVVFHDCENLPLDHRGDFTTSSALPCHGYQWQLLLFPGGKNSLSNTAHMSLYLKCVSVEQDDCEVKAKHAFRVPSVGKVFTTGCAKLFDKGRYWGCTDFLTRAELLDQSKGFLVDGNLTIEVDIQVYMDKASAWRPKKTLYLDMMTILESAKESGDVKFQVGPEEFSANLNILQVRAPELAALANEYPSDTPIPIEGIEPSTFRSLLHFVYTDGVPKPEELQNEARELLDVADRFGCKGLKLAAEAELVDSGITVDTAAEIILLADGKNCALLKETAIDFFASNPTSVMSSPGWANMRESAALLAELLEVAFSNKKRSAPADSDEDRDYKQMCVSSLRQKLDEKGADVDGSREMLISRLEEGENEGGSGNEFREGSTGNSSGENN
jgi:speckle-type POZ protein